MIQTRLGIPGNWTAAPSKTEMPSIICAPAQLKEISLPSLADYARGSIIRGGAADWEALVHPGLLYHLQTDANDVIWSQDIRMADDRWIGLVGPAGRIVFDSTPAPDTIAFVDCDVLLGTVPLAWVRLGQVVLGAPAADVTFAAIPGTYRMLALVVRARSDHGGVNESSFWQVNGDVGNNYDYIHHGVTGAGVAFNGWATAGPWGFLGMVPANGAVPNYFSNIITYFPGYANATMNKTGHVSGQVNFAALVPANTWLSQIASQWRPAVPAAITSIKLVTANNYMVSSTFTLYGVL